MKLFELQDRPVLDKVFPRNIMPQIRKNNLDDAGYEYEKKKIKLSKLKPVQDQRVQGMHDRAMRGFQDGSIRPIIIDKYNYIVNGHHRYDVARSLDMNKVKVIKVNATIEELIDRFSETASDEPTIEEQLKAKLQQKLKEIGKDKPYNDNEDDNSYITSIYNDASGSQPFGENAYIKKAPIPGLSKNEVYDNGTSRHIFLMNHEQPIFLLTLKNGLDGWITTNVVTHSQFRGKGLAVPVYIAVSNTYKQPLYSFTSQTPAGHKIWQNLAKIIPNRVIGYDTDAKKEIPFDSVYDGNLHTRAKLLPKSVQEDVVGMNPHAKKPYFTPEEADRAYDEWINQAQVDQEDGVIIKGTDDKQYRIMTSYNNEHFEDGEVYLDGVTDPTYIDTEGYPDAAELLYYHSATGHYPEEDYELAESVHPDKMTGNEMRKLLDKKHSWDDGIHNPEFINDVRRHNWVLINNYPLAKLGSVEDPYNRIIDPDDDYAMRDSDLSEPIVIAPDRKSVMDGNHRVHKARQMGKTHLPAYFPMIEENLKAEGNCYEAALKKLMDLYMKGNTTAKVVHADITPRLGPLTGTTYGHAWVEDGDKVIDCSNNHTADIDEITGGRKDVYYGITDPKNIKIYNFQQLGKMVTKHHTYGPYPEPVPENFKDGKVKGKSRPGRVKRAGASCKGSVTSLRKKAKNSSGEKSKMYHWCANMKAGRKKK